MSVVRLFKACALPEGIAGSPGAIQASRLCALSLDDVFVASGSSVHWLSVSEKCVPLSPVRVSKVAAFALQTSVPETKPEDIRMNIGLVSMPIPLSPEQARTRATCDLGLNEVQSVCVTPGTGGGTFSLLLLSVDAFNRLLSSDWLVNAVDSKGSLFYLSPADDGSMKYVSINSIIIEFPQLSKNYARGFWFITRYCRCFNCILQAGSRATLTCFGEWLARCFQHRQQCCCCKHVFWKRHIIR